MKRIDEVLYSKINSARKVAEDAIVATNITETLAKLDVARRKDFANCDEATRRDGGD